MLETCNIRYALRKMCASISLKSFHLVVQREFVFGRPVFGLDAKELISNVIRCLLDMMSPLVAPHLDFFPKETHRKKINKLFQSEKWLKDQSSDLCVPMVDLVPLFFYHEKEIVHAKALGQLSNQPMIAIPACGGNVFTFSMICLLISDCYISKTPNGENQIMFHNPLYIIKAEGKIIRNVPIKLYCDDTSGNKSKTWNKHISYFFTLFHQDQSMITR
ncbi:hypothetical protein VP01_5264g3 [Puccinia sorghi]|uniref:Uncharacterized protein n=1 Tax=Puccinia sorghi TaxID=27349 RepID=A0A0L6UL73_9BASI|nr:hypothetical protein VP01_5264g3 [Puccinia sorghi]